MIVVNHPDRGIVEPMKKFFLLLFLMPGFAHAGGLYKCVNGGQTTYQDTPCHSASQQTQLQAGGVNPLVGCYVADFPGYESAGSSEHFEIRAVTSSDYELRFQEGKNTRSLPMKSATPDELREVSRGFHVQLSDGVNMKWPKDTPNQKPTGVYRGRDKDGKPVILAFFFLSNGLARKVGCQ
ncbi:MAG TPA: DUF4124 domain-containing protein [Arenimonas sp.]|nr:DUF4124 domain-containing protein [Arenimonas sp.]